jgi:hypothetical protein
MVIGQVVRGGALSASVSSLEVVYRRKLRARKKISVTGEGLVVE